MRWDTVLEKMAEFFEARLEGYDEHMMTCIECAGEFYPFSASCLPISTGARILDLGCGTGLELEYYFALNPYAQVTGIDLSSGMLDALKSKFPQRDIELVEGSYFDADLGTGIFDAAISVESLHHFTFEEKIPLYKRLFEALKPDGYFILTDYFALSDEEEEARRQELLRLKRLEGIGDDVLCHYDTPLTVPHETEALRMGGFRHIEIIGSWGATHTIKAF